jgi:phosphoribosylaminoimidazole carboxylase PurE protein
MPFKVMILLGSQSDLDATQGGTEFLRQFAVPFTLRIASAQRSPEAVQRLVRDFESHGGQVIICVAGMSAQLPGVVAALTCLPVVAVPIAGPVTAGLDALFSMIQMPQGTPVATMGFGKSGFSNAALLAVQVLALNDVGLGQKFKEFKAGLARDVAATDEKHRIDYRV